jgi:hypothetical protein
MVYQFKITLKGIRPPIWRRFQVKDAISFEQLHQVIQYVMGWENYHLYAFNVGHASIELPEPGESAFMGSERLHAERETVKKHITQAKQKFLYTYDFGDDWEHELVLEEILEAAEGGAYPICLAGKRNCPPEDSGGIFGMQDIAEILKNPDHPEYEDTNEWIGEDYDPEEFDIERINRILEGNRKKLNPKR